MLDQTSAQLVLLDDFASDGARATHHVPPDLTLAQIIDIALPDLPPSEHASLRILLAIGDRQAVVERQYWHCVIPKPNTRILIRIVPQGDGLRSALVAIVQVAATFLAPQLAGFLGVTSKFGIALVGMGLSVVGGLLVNALIPVEQAALNDTTNAARNNAINGWANQTRPDEAIPLSFGTRRYAPPFAATSYTEISGNTQYIRALFTFGYGPVTLEDLRIGDVSIDAYDEVEIEIREGLETDAPVTLYPEQVLEVSENIELTRPLPRDDAGDVVEGDAIETPIQRQTAQDTATASIIFGFPSGLFTMLDNGSTGGASVTLRVRMRQKGDTEWLDLETLTLTSSERTPFFRQRIWSMPSRGTWELEITRMTPETLSSSVSDRVTLAAVQSIRPEYPVNMSTPMALVAVRVKATFQLNGTLGNFNALVKRRGPVWTGDVWMEGESRNPATAFILALQGASNPFSVSDAELDWDALAVWYDWCAQKNLNYDRVIDRAMSLGDLLRSICAAGRATPRHDGLRWGVVIDRPDMLTIAHINPRNSAAFSWSRNYFEPPHAFRITFSDETNDYEQAERLVPWPGYEGDITITEALELPGKTNPDEIWIEGRRRQYELIHRADRFTAICPGLAHAFTRGDLVMCNQDILVETQISARVTAVHGAVIALDEQVAAAPNVDLGMRFFDPDQDPLTSILRPLKTQGSAANAVTLAPCIERPRVGDLVQIGPMAQDSLALKIVRTEPGENNATVLDMVAAAPEIDTLTDAETPPDWTNRVGFVLEADARLPVVPRFTSVTSQGTYVPSDVPGEATGAGLGTLSILIEPGLGVGARTSDFNIETRLQGTDTWLQTRVAEAQGGVTLADMLTGATYELRAQALSADGSASAYGATLNVVIGASDTLIPAALEDTAITGAGGLGSATFQIAIPAQSQAASVQIYRVPQGSTFDAVAHSLGDARAVVPGTTFLFTDGDATRQNLLANGGFDDASAWTFGTGWSQADGTASHSAGTSSDLVQAVVLSAQSTYRAALEISSRTGGALTPSLSGTTQVIGSDIVSNGPARFTLSGADGVDGFTLSADADFDGTLDDIVLFEQTQSCAPQGWFDYYIQPLNDQNIPGALSGPFTLEIL